MDLPLLFQERMKKMLGKEYETFIKSYGRDRAQGLRLNLLKTDREHFLAESSFHLQEVPWVLEGFYYEQEDRPGRHPWHEAGVYYIQEPSAMAAVTLLDPQPGENILDLCAAPGGKTSHIASRLMGNGFLLSNEVHPARARILSQNVERMGAENVVVANEDTGRLKQYFPEFFDRIAVDAPCSGEGMFRKDQAAVAQWSPSNVELCAARQQEILSHAAAMLKDGGRLVYSTCTFAPEENEKAVEAFLSAFPQFELEEPRRFPGFLEGRPDWSVSGRADLKKTVRIWPHRTEGEGHFIAVLKKRERTFEASRSWGGGLNGREFKRPAYLTDSPKTRTLLTEYQEFCRETLQASGDWRDRKELILFGDQLYLLPDRMPDFDGLRVIRPGLHLGTRKKNRFEPSHAWALALRESGVLRSRRLEAGSREAAAYLRGEAIQDRAEWTERADRGWTLVTVDGYSLGWAKLSGGVLKNHYPKGLRR